MRTPHTHPLRRALVRALFALPLALAAAPLAAQAAGGRTVVVGQVVDAQTRSPVPAAQVRVTGTDIAVTTGPDGQFILRVPPGTLNVAIYRLGYETVIESWPVDGPSVDVGMIELAPGAISLEAIEAKVDRIESMRRATGISSRAFGIADLESTTSGDAFQFVKTRAGLTFTQCSTLGTGGGGGAECVRVRGVAARPCVVLDEAPAPGGLRALEMYRPQELARVNVYYGGRVIQVYSKWYLQTMEQKGLNPIPVEAQMQSACQFT